MILRITLQYNYISFFQKQVEKPAEVSRFANFQVTPNMTVAPCVRRKDFTKCQIDKSLEKVFYFSLPFSRWSTIFTIIYIRFKVPSYIYDLIPLYNAFLKVVVIHPGFQLTIVN